MEPFKQQPVTKAPFLRRIFNLPQLDQALISFENLMAQCNSLATVSIDELVKIEAKYNIKRNKKYRNAVSELYGKYLRYCLVDHHLSPTELDNLVAIKRLFGLNDANIGAVTQRIFKETYRKEWDKALQDNYLSDAEKHFLEQLQNTLQLPPAYAEEIKRQSAQNLIKRVLDEHTADKMISPEEDAELKAIIENLDLDLQLDQTTQNQLEQMRLLWQLENGDLPALQVPINLYKIEQCHYTTACEWMEVRRHRTGFSYAGPTMRVKLAKGVYWRMGHFKTMPTTKEELTVIDGGTLYITNRRIIFAGQRGSKTMRLSSIVDFNVFANGMQIIKTSGKNPFIRFDAHANILALIMSRVISEY